MSGISIHKFVGDQLSTWPLACENFRALKNVQVRDMDAGGLKVKLQFNPARMISSAAKLSKADIAARKCFLCRENRSPEQIMIKFEGRKGKKYHILVNPYPIFPDHLVIAADRHTDQSILHRYVDMLDLAKKYDDYTFFYNGPRSGASAPDHHHFQAAPKGLIPLVNDVDVLCNIEEGAAGSETLHRLVSMNDAALYGYDKFTTGVYVIRSQTSKSAAKLFYRLLDCAEIPEWDKEPMFNLFSSWQDGEFRSVVVFRSRHRSHHYFSDGPDHLTMSPGCADMGGVFIVPVKEEYEKMTPELLNEMIEEVSITRQEQERIDKRLTRTQPKLEVGIMSAKEIVFEILSDGAGARKAVLSEGKIEYDGALYDELYFEAQNLSTMFAEASFVLHDVTIGVNFHWQRKENQKFAGALKIIVDKDHLTAVNVVGVEDYLLSVISSEMSASASEEFLKAHAVISRSWVMAQIKDSGSKAGAAVPEGVHDLPSLLTDLDSRVNAPEVSQEGVSEYMKWYDHQDHSRFDVCADDHCQRYQGLTRATGELVRRAVDQTWGQVLTYDGELCDARFSKCCGGRMELFSTCWEDENKPYLQALPDTASHQEEGKCFCNTQDKEILAQVLNNYDQETVDFYRWTVEYDRDEISDLISKRCGHEIGRLMSLEPVERGPSGRIWKLRITGSEKVVVVGKELEIRRILSDSHLKSSAFEVEYLDHKGHHADSSSDWERICLKGSGWGHGVGLCQIGAAVMACEGYTYKEILEHYYPGTTI
jgi:SpoIID/LytB domain protein